ncbi:MAG TPA: hypothetical protein VGB28_08990 [Actinomycetota bacterium]
MREEPERPKVASAWILVARFVAVHLFFSAAYVLVAYTADRIVFDDVPSYRSIGPGEEFETLEEATRAVTRESTGQALVIFGIASPLPFVLNLLAWRRRKEFGFFWVALSPLPLIGAFFFCIPGSWIVANGSFGGPAGARTGS